MSRKIDRRQLLRSAGSFAVSLPVLASLLDAQAARAQAGTVKRFILVTVPHHLIKSDFFDVPLNRAELEALGPSARRLRLTGQNLATLPAWSTTFSAGATYIGHGFSGLLDRLTIISGLSKAYDGGRIAGHNRSFSVGYDVPETGVLSGGVVGLSETLDQVLAQSIYASGAVPRFRSLHFGLNDEHDSASYVIRRVNGVLTRLAEQPNPVTAFNAIFTNLPTGTAPQLTADQRAYRDGRSTSVDLVLESYNRLRSSPKLSEVDRQNVDRFVGFLQEKERLLSVTSQAQCAMPQSPGSNLSQIGVNYAADATAQRAFFKLQFDNIANAIKCDLSRVFTLNCFNHSGYAFLADNGPTHHDDIHAEAKNPDARATAREHQRVLLEHVAYLIEELSVEDPLNPGTAIIDNTVILVAPETGTNGHTLNDLNFFIAGNVGGKFNTGNAYDFRVGQGDPYNSKSASAPYSSVFFNILDAFGVPSDNPARQSFALACAPMNGAQVSRNSYISST